jgi:hypothetical protein
MVARLSGLMLGTWLLTVLVWALPAATPANAADQRLSADEWTEMTRLMKRPFPKVVNPTDTPYSFLTTDPVMGEKKLYVSKRRAGKNPRTLAAFIDGPNGYNICFHGHKKAWMTADPRDRALTFRSGVYPFYLYPRTALKDTDCRLGKHSGEVFHGAMAVYNLDLATSAVSFGRTPGATLFGDAVLEQVRLGALVRHTLRYGDEDRLSYWIGNRPGGFTGGVTTVVLDFSSTAGLAEVRLGKHESDDFMLTVPAHSIKKGKRGVIIYTPLSHEVTLTRAGGQHYTATVSGIADSPYSAFMTIPITIPADLFTAADSGAGAKLILQPEGADAPVAKIYLTVAP